VLVLALAIPPVRENDTGQRLRDHHFSTGGNAARSFGSPGPFPGGTVEYVPAVSVESNRQICAHSRRLGSTGGHPASGQP
jgi:hypothetical protein